MLLRHFYLIDLGKWVVLESERERRAAKPAVYSKSDIDRLRNENIVLTKESEEGKEEKEFMDKLEKISSKNRRAMLDEQWKNEAFSYIDKIANREKKGEKITAKSWKDILDLD